MHRTALAECFYPQHENFPPALVACIRDGRAPHAWEVEELAQKIWREGLAPRGIADPRRARVMASAALKGADCARHGVTLTTV